jgi:glycosyltransferase involved in cell wall biosynthesis
MIRVGILHYAAPPIVGGVESTIYHHARLMVEAGYEVSVIAGRGEAFHAGVPFQRVPEIDSRHPKVLQVGEELAGGQVSQAFQQLRDRLTELLEPVLRETDTCIVHNAVTLHKNLPLTAALRILSDQEVTNLIAWCHDFAWQDKLYAPELHPGYPWDLLRTAWPGVRYVVVSAHRREKLAALLDITAADIEVVTPGVDVTRFLKLEPLTQRLVKELSLLEADPLVLLPARITRRKNIQFAIQVVAALKITKPEVALVVTGPPGPHNPKNIAYLRSLEAVCAELSLSEQVHFLYEFGEKSQPLYVPDAVMADLYRLADLILFPSRREGFGIPVLEAGLARVPVFAADIGPIRESAGNLAHLFDPEGNPKAVAEAISADLGENQAYQLRQRVLKQFTWDAIIQNRVIPIIQESVKT